MRFRIRKDEAGKLIPSAARVIAPESEDDAGQGRDATRRNCDYTDACDIAFPLRHRVYPRHPLIFRPDRTEKAHVSPTFMSQVR